MKLLNFDKFCKSVSVLKIHYSPVYCSQLGNFLLIGESKNGFFITSKSKEFFRLTSENYHWSNLNGRFDKKEDERT
jgi:hypothetical protein